MKTAKYFALLFLMIITSCQKDEVIENQESILEKEINNFSSKQSQSQSRNQNNSTTVNFIVTSQNDDGVEVIRESTAELFIIAIEDTSFVDYQPIKFKLVVNHDDDSLNEDSNKRYFIAVSDGILDIVFEEAMRMQGGILDIVFEEAMRIRSGILDLVLEEAMGSVRIFEMVLEEGLN